MEEKGAGGQGRVRERQRSRYRERDRRVGREVEKRGRERWEEHRGQMDVRTEMKGEREERTGTG